MPRRRSIPNTSSVDPSSSSSASTPGEWQTATSTASSSHPQHIHQEQTQTFKFRVVQDHDYQEAERQEVLQITRDLEALHDLANVSSTLFEKSQESADIVEGNLEQATVRLEEAVTEVAGGKKMMGKRSAIKSKPPNNPNNPAPYTLVNVCL